MRMLRILLVSIFIFVLSTSCFARGIGLSARIGTPGIGFEAIKSINSKFNARVGYNFFDFTYSSDLEGKDVKYEATLELSTIAAIVDWYPGEGGFHLSGGAVINNNKGKLHVIPTETVTAGSRTYSLETIGYVDGNATFDKMAPYVGLGWGNPLAVDKRFGFMFDMGMIYQNSLHLTMDGHGMIAGTAEQAPDIEEKLEGVKVLAFISIGLTFQI